MRPETRLRHLIGVCVVLGAASLAGCDSSASSDDTQATATSTLGGDNSDGGAAKHSCHDLGATTGRPVHLNKSDIPPPTANSIDVVAMSCGEVSDLIRVAWRSCGPTKLDDHCEAGGFTCHLPVEPGGGTIPIACRKGRVRAVWAWIFF